MPKNSEPDFDRINRVAAHFGVSPIKWLPVNIPQDPDTYNTALIRGELPPSRSTTTGKYGKFSAGELYRGNLPRDIKQAFPGSAEYVDEKNKERRDWWRSLGIPAPDTMPEGQMFPVPPSWVDKPSSASSAPVKMGQTSSIWSPRDVFSSGEGNRISPIFLTTNKDSWQFSGPYNKLITSDFSSARETYPAVGEEIFFHTVNPAPWHLVNRGFSVIPQGDAVQDINRVGESYRPAPGSAVYTQLTNLPNFRYIFPMPGPQPMQYVPHLYNLNPNEFTKFVGMYQYALGRKGQMFNNFTDSIPYLRRNGYFNGNDLNVNKLWNPEWGSKYSHLFSDTFNTLRNLQDNYMLARSAYRRAPNNPVILRNYQNAYTQYSNLVRELNHVWRMALPVGPITPAMRNTRDANAKIADEFYGKRPYMLR